MLATYDAAELAEWRIWSRYHPIDDSREDARFAMICRTLANVWRGKGQPAYTIKDFMPDYRGERERPNVRQQFMAMCAVKGIKVTRK